MSKAVLIIDMPKTCGRCPCCDVEYGICEADEHRRECMVHNRPEWCPLKPYKNSIPKEWIKNYASHKASKDLIDCYWHFWEDDVLKMIEEWEKENESRKGEEEK